MADADASPLRILLVEDSDLDAELVAGHLAKADLRFEIERARDRASFEAALTAPTPAVVLADYALPDFDGLTALKLCRDCWPLTPFIFVSGVVGEEFATNAMRLGANDYVVKRNLSRLPVAVERALAEWRERIERVRAQEALSRLAHTLEAQVEARTRERDRIWRLSRDLFMVGDRDGALLSVNPAWWRLLGHEEGALDGSRLADLIHPEEAQALDAMLRRLNAGEPVERFECRLRRRNGEWRWVSWTAVPEGELFYAVGRDITAEQAAAAELARANASLKAEIEERRAVEATLSQMQRLEAVGQLTSGVAHDFNNLLTVVLGNIGFLEDELAESGGGPARMARRLAHIRAAAERGARLTAQLLAFSRRQRLEPRSVDLNETVRSLRDLLQSTMGGAIRLETRLAEALWPAMVDPTQIEMVVLNLAINARDAMEVGGSLTVETSNVTLGRPLRPEDPPAGDYVAVCVSDTGSGMSEDVLAKAFEPFFTTKEPGRGSGLGLAQVHGFAKQSGGGVRIETRLGEGTSVRVFLPRAQAGDPPSAALAPAVRPAREAAREADRDAIVLLVDDDFSVREVTATILQDLGFGVVEAAGGAAALEILRSLPVQLLMVDYAMPGMNGMETAIAARAIRPDLPILFVTGYADLGALREVGEERIVQKPFRQAELKQKIERCLRHAPGGTVVQMRRA